MASPDPELCNFPFDHEGEKHFSPIASDVDNGTLQCKKGKGSPLQDCGLCKGIFLYTLENESVLTKSI